LTPIQVEVHELPARFTELLALAAAGADVIVAALFACVSQQTARQSPPSGQPEP
jgi:hypothetical protein